MDVFWVGLITGYYLTGVALIIWAADGDARWRTGAGILLTFTIAPFAPLLCLGVLLQVSARHIVGLVREIGDRCRTVPYSPEAPDDGLRQMALLVAENQQENLRRLSHTTSALRRGHNREAAATVRTGPDRLRDAPSGKIVYVARAAFRLTGLSQPWLPRDVPTVDRGLDIAVPVRLDELPGICHLSVNMTVTPDTSGESRVLVCPFGWPYVSGDPCAGIEYEEPTVPAYFLCEAVYGPLWLRGPSHPYSHAWPDPPEKTPPLHRRLIY